MTYDVEQTYKAKSIEIFPRGAAAIAPDLSQHVQEIGDCIIQIRSPSNALIVDGVIVDYQIPHGTIGISEDRLKTLGIKDGDPISVSINPRLRPESYEFIPNLRI